MNHLGRLIAVYLLIVNLTALGLFGIDKYKAKQHAWRIPERVLLLVACIGGAYGAYIGMKLFRHKTHHRRFTVSLPILVLLWSVSILYLLYSFFDLYI